MTDNIQNIITEVFAIEDSGTQIKLRDKQKKSLGSFFKDKKNGEPTVAYMQFKDMEIKSGSVVEVSFKEVPYKDGVIKNIIGFREAAGRPAQTPKTAPSQTENTYESPKDERFWDKKAYKQCLWNFWLQKTDANLINPLTDIQCDMIWQVFNQIEQDANKRFNQVDPNSIPF